MADGPHHLAGACAADSGVHAVGGPVQVLHDLQPRGRAAHTGATWRAHPGAQGGVELVQPPPR
eukprot:scaffold72472_cov31-Phaeocystis_antarctica.AAC.1